MFQVGVAPKGEGIELRGDNRKFFASKDPECILSGPADTGKTFAGCLKIHTACSLIPRTQALFVRKNQNALTGTVVKTYQRIIEGQNVRTYGGETPSRFIYPNGSTIWLGGMDNPESCLSSERDYIYCNQAEELTLNDWELLSTRCSGRSAVVAHPQLLGDANPSSSKHWIRSRAAENKLRLLVATHRDNPTIYDEQGNITEEGKRRLAVLENLSGVRKKRLLQGIWATAEGAVFDTFDVQIHRCERDAKEMVSWYLALDEGYTNPAVILLIGADSDRRWHVFREFYKRGMLESDVVSVASEWNKEKLCEVAAVDEAAAGLIASLIYAGVNAMPGKGRIFDGIAAIQDRLKVQVKDASPKYPNGRPRLTVDPSCINTINEFESYRWKETRDVIKDVPEDCDNHSMGALRYLHDVLGQGIGSFNNSSGIYLPPTNGPKYVSTRTFVPRRM